MSPWAQEQVGTLYCPGFLEHMFLLSKKHCGSLSQGDEYEMPNRSQILVSSPDRGKGMSRYLPGEWAGEPDSQVPGLQALYHQNYTSVFQQGIAIRKLFS